METEMKGISRRTKHDPEEWERRYYNCGKTTDIEERERRHFNQQEQDLTTSKELTSDWTVAKVPSLVNLADYGLHHSTSEVTPT